eukprot:TRINITY_DN759_c0_g1_i5.p1 TRINITY_DN759_c0_g1~~TRINITY_DN759_c0_g1_i5.p1  ORF type:complete len:1776 (+),score=713.18 TRINITY_DN759_c0_g1_i5:304-5631(+)
MLTTIEDILATIRQKIPNSGGSDHGLFLPGEDESAGKWLKEEKTIQFYDLKQGDTLEFRKKHGVIKIQLLDGSKKTMILDLSAKVSELVDLVAEKYSVANPEEYGLQSIDDQEQDSWLKNETSLHEQGIEEGSTILFKKRFYFSDHNIDSSDPVQLHLTYSQAVLQILADEHPTTLEEAINFAALQMQIQFGNHNPQVHKSGFIKVKEFVPKQWQKAKNVEKKIYAEHRKLVGLSELNAKFRYLQQMRALKTFGVTQFMVKEPVKGSKKKFTNLILGITRDSLLRLDPSTREVLDSYPLTTLKRWAAAPSKFTMDFGEYREDYYVVHTSEGDEISALIAGYIDIILQRRKPDGQSKKNLDDDEMIAEEESVLPQGGHAISSSAGSSAYAGTAQEYVGAGKKGVIMSSSGVQGSMAMGAVGQTAQAVHGSSGTAGSVQQAASAWRALSQSTELERSVKTVTSMSSDLGSYVPGTGQRDLDVAFDKITKAAGDLAASATGDNAARMEAAAQVLSKWKIGVNPQTAQAQLNASAKAVAQATASLVGQATGANVNAANLLSSCQAVAAATAQLVAACKGAAAATSDMDSGALIQAADGLAGATAQLVQACQAQVAAINNGDDPAAAKAALIAAAKAIGAATTQLLTVANQSFQGVGQASGRASSSNSGSEKLAKDLLAAGKAIMEACGSLLTSASAIAETALEDDQINISNASTDAADAGVELVEYLKSVTDMIINDEATEDHQQQLLVYAKGVGNATHAVVGAIKQSAANSGSLDTGLAQQLATSAKTVAEEIARMVGMAKDIGTTGQSTTDKLREEFGSCIDVVDSVSELILEPGISAQQLLGFAKQIAAASTKMVTTARQTASTTNNENLANELLAVAEALADATAAMVGAVKAYATRPNDEENATHLKETVHDLGIVAKKLMAVVDGADLVEAAKEFAATQTQLISSAKGAAGTASADSQRALVAAAKPAAMVMTELVTAAKAYEVQSIINNSQNANECGMALTEACRAISDTTQDTGARQLLNQAIAKALSAMENLAELATNVAANSSLTDAEVNEIYDLAKVTGSDIMNLLYSATTSQSEFVSAAKGAAINATQLSESITNASNKVQQEDYREALLDSARALAGLLQNLVMAGGQVVGDPEDTEAFEEMSELAKMGGNSILTILENLREAFPEINPSLNDESAINAILASTETGSSTVQCPTEIAHAAMALTNAVCSSVLDSKKGQSLMVEHARNVSASAKILMTQANELAEALSDPMLAQQLTEATQSITAANSDFINNIRGNLKDPVANERFNVGCKTLSSAASEVVVAASIAAGDSSPDADVQKYVKSVAKSITALRYAIQSGDKAALVEASKAMAQACTALNNSCGKLAGRTPSEDLKNALIEIAQAVMGATSGIISCLKTDLTQEENAEAAQQAVSGLETTIGNVLEAAAKCSNDIQDQEANAIDDPVERELQAAARNIDAMLSTLDDIEERAKDADTNFTLEEKQLAGEIVGCARSVASATAQLMRAAKESQHELAALHKAAPNSATYLQDPKLKEGLVGSAKSVAGAIELMVEAANEQAMGTSSEEKLIACSKSVASTTADLVFASRAKCKPGSANQQKLSAAAKQVAGSTQEMVKTAKAARAARPQETTQLDSSYKNAQIAEIEAQTKVLELERQLEEARRAMTGARKQKYAGAGVDLKKEQEAKASTIANNSFASGSSSSSSSSSSSTVNQSPSWSMPKKTVQPAQEVKEEPAGDSPACGECGCTSFEAHPFKRHQCKNCFHTH